MGRCCLMWPEIRFRKMKPLGKDSGDAHDAVNVRNAPHCSLKTVTFMLHVFYHKN